MGKNKLSLKAILPKLAVLIGIMHPVYADNFPIQPLQNDPAVRKQLDRRTYEPVNQSNPDNLFPFRSHRGTVEHRTGSIRVTAASNIPLGGGVELQQLQYGGNIGFHTRFTGHGWKVHDPYDDTAQKTGYGKGQSVSDGYGPVAYAYTVKGSMVHPADGYEAPQGGNYPPPSKYGAHDRYSISVKGKASHMVQKPLDNTYGWNKAWENTKTAWSNGADYFTEAGRRIRSPIGIDLNQSIGTNAYNYTRYSIARTNGVIEAAFGIPTIVASNIWGIGSAAVDSYRYNEEYQKYRQDILAQNNMDAKTLFWHLYQTQQKHEYRQMEDADWQQFGQDFGNNLSRLEQEYPLTAESLKLAGNVAGLSSLGRNAAANTAKNSLDDIAGGAFKGGAGHDDFAQAAAAKFEQQSAAREMSSVDGEIARGNKPHKPVSPPVGGQKTSGGKPALDGDPYSPSEVAKRTSPVETTQRRLDSIINGATPGSKTTGKTTQYNKKGTFEDAKADFDTLNVQNRRTDANGTISGKLPDGRDVNVRNHSSRENTPTLEIQRKSKDGKKVVERTKIRYNR